MFLYMRSIIESRRNDEGASAVEYGLLVAAIAALIVVAVFGIGRVVSDSFKGTCTSLKSSSGNTAATCPA